MFEVKKKSPSKLAQGNFTFFSSNMQYEMIYFARYFSYWKICFRLHLFRYAVSVYSESATDDDSILYRFIIDGTHNGFIPYA
jgi:hypothetical protein